MARYWRRVSAEEINRLITADTVNGLVASETVNGLVEGDTVNGLVTGDTVNGLVTGDTVNDLVIPDSVTGSIDIYYSEPSILNAPAGWSIDKISVGCYRLTHNFGSKLYGFNATSSTGEGVDAGREFMVNWYNKEENTIDFTIKNGNGANASIEKVDITILRVEA